ncbi:MAG: hypothetical protein EOP51_12595, partial [Sphingobacteriales bacterium]
MLVLLFLLTGTGWAQQVYMNGNLRTGTSTSNGVAAPAGYFASELQPGNGSVGLGANLNATLSVADDFIVPAGEIWNISTVTFYAYSTGYAGTAAPFDTVFVKIYNTD